ncbi:MULTISPECIES: hypothetical protein [unclassified Microcoleus]
MTACQTCMEEGRGKKEEGRRKKEEEKCMIKSFSKNSRATSFMMYYR